MKPNWLADLAILLLIGGCASTPSSTQPAASSAASPVAPTPQAPASVPHLEGRISVTIQAESMQHTSASFELDGDAQQGEMKFYGPFGGLALVLQWEPGKAVLIEGDRKRTVPSLEWLMQRLTGASLPIPMIFDWLYGKPVQSDDWWFEPRESQSRYLHAVRLQPLPRIELTIALKNSAP